jgi:hypothetical protein
MNRIQSVERHNGQLASVLRDARGIIFIDYLEKPAKLHELGNELLPHPPYLPDLASSDLFLFADLKECLLEKNLALIKR